MHELCLIHTDLKPENILLVSPEYIKVPDYKVYFVLLFTSPTQDLPCPVLVDFCCNRLVNIEYGTDPLFFIC
ncbi:Serine/threonine-protein kinase AFC2 [Zea mays]|jgi:serine/threonine protein kinase|uniref:Serine/threonine-protein kinase AFC2 n=1 Tax=Zea mays TaxID=4577 RepID=A0A1D6HC59_MAIZE|nr:Serine/threonine-protein kinase AFC2 [Zea mays]AQK72277.1 Serine/threonine-protein kinase AFC2 [Zea mays]AQK72302.1 Serine/threonine-protein kinase AFC2 [Zea mays]